MMHNYTTFHHSGDLGDIIYSLPTLKYLTKGKKCKLFIDYNMDSIASFFPKIRGKKEDGTPTGICDKKFRFIQPLLEFQSYINSAARPNEEIADINLDFFRKMHNQDSICNKYRKFFSTPLNYYEKPWIEAQPIRIREVIFARTDRYQNEDFPWGNLVKKYPDAGFVGLKTEHEGFCEKFGKVDFISVENALHMASVIQGSELFIGNQSLAYSIAEGMKKNSIQETSSRIPDCIYPRQNAKYFINGKFVKIFYDHNIL